MHQSYFLMTRVGVACILLSVNASSKEPDELSKLRTQWIEKKGSLVSPVDKKYRLELESLKTRFTKAGDLDAALAVNAELLLVQNSGTSSKLESSTTSESTGTLPVGKWMGRWDNRLTSVFYIDAKGYYVNSTDREDQKNTYKMRYQDSAWVIKAEVHNYINRFTVIGDRLFLEQWGPMSLFHEGKPPTAFGYATEVK